MSPVYLGDGVYVAIEHGMARLTTGSHLEAEADNIRPDDIIRQILQNVQVP